MSVVNRYQESVEQGDPGLCADCGCTGSHCPVTYDGFGSGTDFLFAQYRNGDCIQSGTNVFKGEISYVTQALAAVLQLGDDGLFHFPLAQLRRAAGAFSGDKKRAMAHAISNTITSVVGKLHYDGGWFRGTVFHELYTGYGSWNCHGKGCCSRRYLLRYGAAVAAALYLIRRSEKTKHKVIIPDLGRIADWIVRHYGVFLDRISGGVGPGNLRLHTRMCITILREHCRRA